MDDGPTKTSFDFEQYERRVREGPCFVCATVAAHPDYRHHVAYRDDDTIATATIAGDPLPLHSRSSSR